MLYENVRTLSLGRSLTTKSLKFAVGQICQLERRLTLISWFLKQFQSTGKGTLLWTLNVDTNTKVKVWMVSRIDIENTLISSCTINFGLH